MTSRAFRPTAAVLSILLLSGAPIHAAPVTISQVIQVLNPPKLRLRSLSQNTNWLVGEGDEPLRVASAVQKSAAREGVEIPDATTTHVTMGDTLLSGVTVSDDPQVGVDVVNQGDVQGTICDCGEILLPGGIPKWPLLFLAAIPFFFIHGDDDTPPTVLPTPTPVPTTTPAIPEVPEPASLLLFGSGLVAFGASLRRRSAKRKLSRQIQTTEEG